MNYARCICNQPYLHAPDQPIQEEPLFGLTVGKVYKVVSDPTAEQHGMTRIIDESFGEPGSEDGYLYPSDYFEPFLPDEHLCRTSLTIYLDEYVKGVLHAEAVASNKSVSALMRDWVEERLDLPYSV
ncbi:MAG: hypothetical protein OXO50_22475 [Caldilineaceae bacterium]|nr:hypothetical protein [Caldilineaceae bacterium]